MLFAPPQPAAAAAEPDRADNDSRAQRDAQADGHDAVPPSGGTRDRPGGQAEETSDNNGDAEIEREPEASVSLANIVDRSGAEHQHNHGEQAQHHRREDQ